MDNSGINITIQMYLKFLLNMYFNRHNRVIILSIMTIGDLVRKILIYRKKEHIIKCKQTQN